MNQYLVFPVLVCWLAVIAGEAVLVALLTVRRVHRSNVCFYTFIVFNLLRSLSLLALASANATDAYFIVYWLAQPLETGLLFWVVYGVFRELFQPYESLPSGLLPRFFTACTVAVALIIAFCLLAFSHPHYKLFAAMLAFQRGAAIAVVAVVVLITAVSNVFAVPWRSRVAALAWGMVIYLAGRTIAIHIATLLSRTGGMAIRVAVTLSFLAAEILWIAAFARSEAPVPLLDEATIEQLHRLLRLLRERRRSIQVPDSSGLEVGCRPPGALPTVASGGEEVETQAAGLV